MIGRVAATTHRVGQNAAGMGRLAYRQIEALKLQEQKSILE
jgi:hypothetical protein